MLRHTYSSDFMVLDEYCLSQWCRKFRLCDTTFPIAVAPPWPYWPSISANILFSILFSRACATHTYQLSFRIPVQSALPKHIPKAMVLFPVHSSKSAQKFYILPTAECTLLCVCIQKIREFTQKSAFLSELNFELE